MRNIALVAGVIMMLGSFAGCINDPTVDQTVMSATDSDSDTDSTVEVDSSTDTAE